VSWFSFGAELRYVTSLTITATLRENPDAAKQLSFALGPRIHVRVGTSSLHPGISYARGIGGLMAAADYHVVGVDLPVTF
jgi:hypothetical protein